MPLEELLKLYGQNSTKVNAISRENDEVPERRKEDREKIFDSIFLVECNG